MYFHSNSKQTFREVLACAILLLVVGDPARAPAQSAKPFYEGKTIQIVISSGIGATTDITGRLLTRYLGKYIPGNPNIIAHNMPGGGGLVAANYVYNVSKPD